VVVWWRLCLTWRPGAQLQRYHYYYYYYDDHNHNNNNNYYYYYYYSCNFYYYNYYCCFYCNYYNCYNDYNNSTTTTATNATSTITTNTTTTTATNSTNTILFLLVLLLLLLLHTTTTTNTTRPCTTLTSGSETLAIFRLPWRRDDVTRQRKTQQKSVISSSDMWCEWRNESLNVWVWKMTDWQLLSVTAGRCLRRHRYVPHATVAFVSFLLGLSQPVSSAYTLLCCWAEFVCHLQSTSYTTATSFSACCTRTCIDWLIDSWLTILYFDLCILKLS